LNGTALDDRFTRGEGVPEGIAVSRDSSSAATGACQDRSKPPPLLGTRDYLPAYYAAGWGEVAPAVVSNGGASASGTIYGIHWSSWGGKVAVGRGLHPTFKPRGGYYPRPVVTELRAYRVRRCEPGQRPVYTRFSVRDQVRPGGPMGKWYVWARNICVSYFG
jgi:hypothetical protein